MKTRLTETLGIRYPIVQGGLSYLAYAELAAAVSQAGGLGQVTATFVGEPDWLRLEIAKVRRLTDRPFAVNFALGRRFVPELVDVVLAERVPVVSITGGNPEPVLSRLAGSGIKTLVLVAGVRQAVKAESLGADIVVAVGCEGGGHIGRDDVTTLVLVPRVVSSVKVPVVASGGIADGRGLAAALAFGAEGVEMGTRFVATQECVAHERYKAALVAADETETVVIERSIGRPARVLKTEHATDVLARELGGASAEEILALVRGEYNRKAAIDGVMTEGLAWAGQSVGLIDDLPTVAELVERTMAQAREACLRLGRACAASAD
jgi:NADH:quinone reductase (non-electrogenic)